MKASTQAIIVTDYVKFVECEETAHDWQKTETKANNELKVNEVTYTCSKCESMKIEYENSN